MNTPQELLKVYNEHHELVFNESCGLFQKKELLGSGVYGKTYTVKDRNKVLKEIRIEDPFCETTKNGYSCEELSEIIIHTILAKKDSNHFPIIYGYALCGGKLQLLMEKMDYTLDYFINNFEITDSDYLFIINEVFQGIKSMHQLRISHNDLKLDNIMVKVIGNKYKIKIIDFGLSNKYSYPTLDQTVHKRAGIETWSPSYDPHFFLFNIHKRIPEGPLKKKVCDAIILITKASKSGKNKDINCDTVYSDYSDNYSRPSKNYQSSFGINKLIKMFRH